MAHENATPRPWRLRAYSRKMLIEGNVHQIAGGDDFPMAFVPAWDAPDVGEVDGAVEAKANADLIVEAVNAYDTLRAENERLRAENAKLSDLNETQAEKLRGCPFDRDEYELDLDVPCPVCGSLGHPDSPNLCLHPTKGSARTALSPRSAS